MTLCYCSDDLEKVAELSKFNLGRVCKTQSACVSELTEGS